MSYADELLNSLSEDGVMALTADSSTEPHIIIDSNRKVSVPDELKRIAVQYDHNVETVTFDCPRYWDEHDMSQMKVYINYKCPSGSLGCYIVDSVTIDETDETIMHFDWTVSRNATLKDGSLSFLVCIRKTNTDTGEEVNHWNSELNTEMYISKGLECDEITEELYPDIITQLLLRMDSVEAVFAPTVEITEIEGGHHLKMVDVNGTYEFDVMDGAKGDKGDAFTYSDFTAEQLAALKGEKGDAFTYSDFTAEQLAALKGEKGDTGSGFKVLGYYESLTVLESSVTNPSVGDAYGVGSSEPYNIYIYTDINGWVNNGVLQGAKGKDGMSATHSWNGTTLTVTSASGTSSANLRGPAGHTPVKGVDYFTESDKQEIATAASEMAPPELFFAKYGVTTSAEIDAAYTAGKLVVCNVSNRTYVLRIRFSSTKHSFHSTAHDSIWSIVVDNNVWGSETHETFAAEDHTHNVDDLTSLGENPTGGYSNDTTAFWISKGSGKALISATEQLINQPVQDGFLLNFVNNRDVFQIFRDQTDGTTYWRSGDSINNWFQNWKKVYDDANKPTLSEIGAASSTHASQHGASGSDPVTPAAIGAYPNGSKGAVNCNNLSDGTWTISASATNGPGAFACTLFHKDWNIDFASQIAFGADHNVYYRVKTGGSWLAWQEMYSTLRYPSPSKIGAVAKSGDTMTGKLTISHSSYPDLDIKNTGSGSITKIRNSAHRTQIMSQEDDSNYRVLTLNDKSVTTDAKNILQIEQIDGGTQTAAYNVYHTGYKPTAADVGAAPSGFGLGTSAKIVTGKSITEICAMGTGFYRGQTVTNAPDTKWWYFLVFKDSDSYQNVIAIDYGNGTIYRGSVTNGTWNGWAKIVTEDSNAMRLVSGKSGTWVTASDSTSTSYTGINCVIDDNNRSTLQITRPKDGSTPSVQLFNRVGGTSTKIGDIFHSGNRANFALARMDMMVYTGTGKYGSANPNNLVCIDTPRVVIVVKQGESLEASVETELGGWNRGFLWVYGASTVDVSYVDADTLHFALSTNSNGKKVLSWYGTKGQYSQYNNAGSTYYAFVFYN